MDVPTGPENGPDDGGGGGEPEGIRYANDGLRFIAAGNWGTSEGCQKVLEGFAKLAGGSATAASIKTAVMSMAQQAIGFVYDGAGSTVALAAEKFPGAASATIRTVGEWFAADNARQALSQLNGSAIWIVAAQWAPGYLTNGPFSNGTSISRYGLGTLLHELLHKKDVGGFEHIPMERVLIGAGVWQRPLGTNGISSSLTVCF